ncbi:hypothetical protein Taro_054120 [Colocasia esculenta]|uniref:Uncharacterized protein n=1 Tax=Colocasia esculenta TaxID=4460 RepID=A0A843XMP8_COLES|nr:hypothetical protein [Colocasia esculenta]
MRGSQAWARVELVKFFVEPNSSLQDGVKVRLNSSSDSVFPSSDRFEKVNYAYGNDGEKNQAHGRTSVIDNGEVGNDKGQNENPYYGMISINGCSYSEAAQLLNDRWAAAMHSYNDPSVDSSERPVMYSGASGSSWGHLKLPHQMDFLAELRRAIHSAEATKGHLGGDRARANRPVCFLARKPPHPPTIRRNSSEELLPMALQTALGFRLPMLKGDFFPPTGFAGVLPFFSASPRKPGNLVLSSATYSKSRLLSPQMVYSLSPPL